MQDNGVVQDNGVKASAFVMMRWCYFYAVIYLCSEIYFSNKSRKSKCIVFCTFLHSFASDKELEALLTTAMIINTCTKWVL